jgi:hypothetical protein
MPHQFLTLEQAASRDAGRIVRSGRPPLVVLLVDGAPPPALLVTLAEVTQAAATLH